MAMEIDTFKKRMQKAFEETFDAKTTTMGYTFDDSEGVISINVFVSEKETNKVMVDFTIYRKTYGELFAIAIRLLRAWKKTTRISAKAKARMEAEANGTATQEDEE